MPERTVMIEDDELELARGGDAIDAMIAFAAEVAAILSCGTAPLLLDGAAS